jgi:SOS-response transcriptional repressor LexA
MEKNARTTKRQRELLAFIDAFIKGNNYGPSYREIMRALGYKSVSTVAVHVDGLITKGYLRKHDNSARSIEVVSTASVSTSLTHHETWLLDQIEKRIKAGATADEQRAFTTTLISLGIHSGNPDVYS